MPLYLKPTELDASLYSHGSVLFVVCGVCPKMCMSAERKAPYFSPRRLFGRKDCFDDYVDGLRNDLEVRGIRTGVLGNQTLPAMMCLLPQKRRDRLAKCARKYEAVAVIGCKSAVLTIEDAISPRKCSIYSTMQTIGIANFKSKMKFPASMTLETPGMNSIATEKVIVDDGN